MSSAQAGVNYTRPEICNGRDDDLDGTVDEGCSGQANVARTVTNGFMIDPDDFIRAGTMALVADVTEGLAGFYLHNPQGNTQNAAQACAYVEVPDGNYYVTPNARVPSSAQNMTWWSNGLLAIHPGNSNGTALAQSDVFTFQDRQLFAGVTFPGKTNSTTRRSFELRADGSKPLCVTLEPGVHLGRTFISTDINQTANDTGGSVSADYEIFKVTSAPSGASDTVWDNAPALSTFTGNGTATDAREVKIVWQDDTVDKLYFRCTQTDASVQATTTAADSSAIFVEDYCGIRWRADSETDKDATTFLVAANANATESVLDRNYPLGVADNAYDASPLCTFTTGATWSIFCQMDLGFTGSDGLVIRGDFEMGDKDAGVGALFKFWKSTTDSSEPIQWGGWELSATVATGGSPDVTAPTVSNCSVPAGNITTTAADVICDTNEAGTVLARYDTDNDGAVSGADSATTTPQSCSPPSCTVHLSGLTAGQAYEVRLEVTDGSGNTGNGAILDFTTDSETPLTNVFYIAPNGSDAADGSSSTPWKTFPFALDKTRLLAGYTLIAKSGTYTLANNGAFSMNCAASGGNTNNGTATERITVKAEDPHQAFYDGSGAANPVNVIFIRNCAFWTIEGFRVTKGNFNDSNPDGGYLIGVADSNNLIIRKNLLHNNNGWKPSGHVIYCDNCTSVIVQENQIYNYIRHGILFRGGGGGNEIRRNYTNPRNKSKLHSGTNERGCVSMYPSSNNFIENNICEGSGANLNFWQIGSGSNNGRWLGNIAYGLINGFHEVSKQGTPGLAEDSQYIDNAAINTNGSGFRLFNVANQLMKRNTAVDNGSSGFSWEGRGSDTSLTACSGNCTFTAESNFSLNNGTGFFVKTADYVTWTQDYSWGAGNDDNFNPNATDSRITNESESTSHGMGSCKLWQPDGSALLGAGLGGENIGARILFMYEGGILTSTKMWNTPTNRASWDTISLVAGVNDVAGDSLFDIGARIGLGSANGCDYPAGY